jgi:RNA dependent RNA polymerase
MISLDTRLAGEALLLRKSMIKFTGSNASDIEICGSASRPLPTYLNRQYIKILEDLGVDPKVLMELQKDAVERLRRTTLSAANAASFLKRELVGKTARVPWLIEKLYYIGFEFLEDPFLRGTVELAVLSQLRELKHRSRIFVEQAVTLYGIMDETDTLAEGEVYCCTDKKVVIGKVAVTRAPAMHPGDIQIANAVDIPDESPLNALHNCVVFSQRGRRDLPSQLSGGDLDGDIYSVIYDPRLLPPRVVEPADYPRVAPKDIGRLVTRKDMTDFFIDFMENDQLGRIALLHMQLADRKDGGTQHPDCVTLAEMASTAVDFSKTGVGV